MKNLFLMITGKSSKDNTYKFALMKFLLDFSKNEPLNNKIEIPYSKIAEKFLEYYWFQECKYKIKQDFKVNNPPVVISIIRKHCGIEYIPYSYEKYFKSRQKLKSIMIDEIEKNALSDVIPRLQPKNNYTFYQHFHTLNDTRKKFYLPPKNKRHIVLNKEAHIFFKENYNEVSKILIYEWSKFLEKTNFTPKLIAKIEGLGIDKRKSLKKYREI